ncbi:MAG: hypothetical protein RQ899_14125 [Pseudomonadales bacterium]|nr:hypothetical protein [Pseudomonadales bacterium]
MIRHHSLGLLTTLTLILAAAPLSAQTQIPRLEGKPDLNGIWQAMNSANWNLEAHPAEKLDDFWELGALASIPAGQSVVVEGRIPYLPEALAKREELRAGWPKSDPETYCYLPGIPRATYMPYPFQIFQGDGDILMVYSYTSANRTIHMSEHSEAPVDIWMGRSNGTWQGDTLEVLTSGFNARAHLDRAGNHFSPALKVTERFTLANAGNVIWYEATLEDPNTYSRPWTIRMPLYKHLEDNARLLEHKCVPFAEELLYKDLELPAQE